MPDPLAPSHPDDAGVLAAIGELVEASELDILLLMQGTLSLPDIASTLYLSPNTIKTRARAIYRKLGAHSRAEAVTVGQRRSLIRGCHNSRPHGRAGDPPNVAAEPLPPVAWDDKGYGAQSEPGSRSARAPQGVAPLARTRVPMDVRQLNVAGISAQAAGIDMTVHGFTDAVASIAHRDA